jgi:mono/diheme cytochrome c family protein
MTYISTPSLRRAAPLLALCAALHAGLAGAAATSPAQLLAEQQQLAGTPADAARGRQFFTSRHGREWSCSSCHGETPTQPGKHASTGKTIGPLAPAFNAERFSDTAKVEKWFRRNCNDVVGRECSAGEKADVLAFLSTLKP